MDLNCFQNFIGWRGACATGPAPLSGLYLNDLEGISLLMAAQTASWETAGAQAFFEEKIALGLRLLVDELPQHLQQAAGWTLEPLLGRYRAGHFQAGQYSAPLPSARGLWLRLRQSTSALQQLYLYSVSVLANANAPGQSLVVDDGGALSTYSFDAVAGQIVRIPLNYAATSPALVVRVDNTSLPMNQSRLQGLPLSDFVELKPYDGQAIAGDSSYGLQLHFSVRCRTEELACALMPQLGTAALYRIGVELARSRASSERVNFFTQDEAQAQRLAEQWMKAYREQMQGLLYAQRHWLKQYRDPCLSCRQGRHHRMIP